MRGYAYFAMAVVFFLVGLWFVFEGSILVAAGLAVTVIVAWYGYYRKGKANYTMSTAVVMPEPLEKALRDYADIQVNIESLNDRVLVSRVRRLQLVAGKIIEYLQSHPQCISAANRFINYYQDRVAALMRQCVSLEATGINTPDSKKILQRTKNAMLGFEEAYQQQFAKIIDMQLLDMDAELKVAHQELAMDGIDCQKCSPRELSTAKEEDLLPEPKAQPRQNDGFWSPKTIGAIAVAVFGGYSLYQYFNRRNN